jgi:hypothetical protein|tara:strand:- start:113 stop:286 length:174 start_codon:yes stop_codon:yes gene_type:complete
MAGSIGIGLIIPHEPVLPDTGNLNPDSWDIILETGIGVDAMIFTEQNGLKMLLQSAS